MGGVGIVGGRLLYWSGTHIFSGDYMLLDFSQYRTSDKQRSTPDFRPVDLPYDRSYTSLL